MPRDLHHANEEHDKLAKTGMLQRAITHASIGSQVRTVSAERS